MPASEPSSAKPSSTLDTPNSNKALTWAAILGLLVACTLLMGAGWGIRGSFGHSRGAMMPGAMLGVAIAVCAMRPDWWKRAAIITFACSMGWGVGGQSSYGIIIGYSSGGTVRNSLFGYASLFLVGGLYSGVGAGFLGLALTKPRSYLNQFVGSLSVMYLSWLGIYYLGMLEPVFEMILGGGEETANAWYRHLNLYGMSIEYFDGGEEARQLTYWLHDTKWVTILLSTIISAILWAAVPRWRDANALIFILSAGWFAGMFLFLEVLGLRMNPYRAESWAGVLGMQIALYGYLWFQQNRASMMLVSYGFIAGAIGFSIGDFIQMLGRGQVGPIAEYAWLQEFGYWTVMEQFFGYVMGLGVAIGIVRLVNNQLTPAQEDTESKSIDCFSLFFLFGALLVFNFRKVYRDWVGEGKIPENLFGFSVHSWAFAIAIVYLLIVLVTVIRIRKHQLKILPESGLGRAQLLALLMIVAVLVMYLMLPYASLSSLFMFLVAIAGGIHFIFNPPNAAVEVPQTGAPAESKIWRVGIIHYLLWVLSPLLLWWLASTTVEFGIIQKQYRFPEEEEKGNKLLEERKAQEAKTSLNIEAYFPPSNTAS